MSAASGQSALIWVVDDHAASAEAVAEIARGLGLRAATFFSAEAAIGALSAALRGEAELARVLVTDLRMPGLDGMALLARFRADAPGVSVVVVTAHGSIDEAVRAIQAGALDFLSKPLALERVEAVLRNAVARAEIEAELARVKAENAVLRAEAHPELVFRSAAMRDLLDRATMAARSDATVLLVGETGTGKERLARVIHEASSRARGPLVATHLAALAEGVLESELFGHERGAFTGASARHAGRFEAAHRGTLFLDEIAEIDARTQIKLLRVLQERVVTRVGGSEDIHVDVRLIAATHRDLEAEVAAGRFRADLYYRINVVRLRVPPLRERPEDIPVLLGHFLRRFAARHGRPTPELPAEISAAILCYTWPGNVRELENLAERLVVLGPSALRLDELSSAPAASAPAPTGDVDLTATLERLERQLIEAALRRHPDNKAAAARSLGLTREGLRYKLQKYDID